MSLQSSQEIVDDFEQLLEDDEGYDVIIYAGENENMKEIHAHSSILRIKSQYFRITLSNPWAEKKDGKHIFKKPNVLPHLFKMIIRFTYCGKIELENLQGPDVLRLFIAADEINIQTLINHIKEYLVNHQNQYLQQNPIEILELSHQYEETFSDLLDLTLSKICKEPEILFNSDKFTSLDDSLLKSIFKRNDLLLNGDILFKSNNFINLKAPLLKIILEEDNLLSDEIIIWDNLIKWCLAQNPNISQDPTEWSEDEIEIMEKTIHEFVPLIRFYDISSENFITKVYPFKEIIPKDLISNTLIFHMAPTKQLNVNEQLSRKLKRNNVDSVIINKNHIAIFTRWINGKPDEFKLLYRASRDGMAPAAFHSRCDNKGATICIAKVSNSEQIVGGYNPFSWDSSSGWKPTYDSFIFSFTNKNNLQSANVGYSYGNDYSIQCNANCGPCFGGRDDNDSRYGNSDLCYNSTNGNTMTWYSSNNAHSYPKIDISVKGTFNVDDYEVFRVFNVTKK